MSKETTRWVVASGLIVAALVAVAAGGGLHGWSEPRRILAADVARYFTMVLGSAVIGVTLVVAYTYNRIYFRFRRQRGWASWRGLLPRHVVLVATSYTMMIVGSLVDLGQRIHEPLTFRPAVYSVTYLLGLWAMWDVLGNAKHRSVEMDETLTRGPDET